MSNCRVNQCYKNFKYTRVEPIEELNCTLIELTHLPTGARIMQIANDDDENLFNLSFRTWPTTSNGVAHILEHTVLCGSEHFPVRDPFFGMNRRSLNTFMNAMTGADFTCYPAASQVPNDFYNLLEVYLDAVFHPHLLQKSFQQEGHRLEFATIDDPTSPLLFKGIVFNEMKGALSTGEARLHEALMQRLLPDLTYGINSGGEPLEIPNLTYEELKAFHEKFYHPSRCLFFFYGNLPLEQHLDFLETHAFKEVQAKTDLPLLPFQPRFSEKKRETLYYPIAEQEDPKAKTLVALSWLTCAIKDQVELLVLNILDLALMGTDASPLKLALLKSNLCKQADSWIDNEMSEIPFFLVCKGCEKGAARKLETLIEKRLTQIAKEGLPDHLIEGAIHQLELSRCEITGNSSPYGLSLFFRSALLLQHGIDPIDGLCIHTLFNKVRAKLKDQSYLPSLIQKHFLDNPHFVSIEMQPDSTLNNKESQIEADKLAAIRSSLDEPQINTIIEEAQTLAHFQEEEESLDILPKVTLADVPQQSKDFSLHQESYGPFELYHHDCFTNDLLYADLIFDLPHISEHDLPYVRLFSYLLPQLGCGGRSYMDNLDYILLNTGGVGLSLDLSIQAEDPNHLKPSLSLRGKALKHNLSKLFPLLSEMVTSVDFTDIARIKELLMQHYHSLENSIQNSSLRYAINQAACGLSPASTIVNRWYGLEYYWKIKEVCEQFEADPSQLVTKMQTLQKSLLGLKGADLVLSCDTPTYDLLKKEQFYGLGEIPTHPFSAWNSDFALTPSESQGRITASPVAFTTMLFPTIPYVHPDTALLGVASEIMENKVLHKRIREQGGAYGSGAVNSSVAAQFYFYAFRDPHLASTIDAFRESIEAIAKGAFDDRDIEEAKLGIFQDLDSPIAPGSRAITSYFRQRGNRTFARREAFRQQLFKADKKAIQKAAEAHLLQGLEKSTVISFASKELLEKEVAKSDLKPFPLYTI